MTTRDRSIGSASPLLLTALGLGTPWLVTPNAAAQLIFDEPVFFQIPDETPPLLIREYYSDLVVGDFNADGWMDVAITSSPCRWDHSGYAGVTMFYGDGRGAFPTITKIPLTHHPRSIATGDLDGDGDADLAIAGRAAEFGGESTVIVLMNDGGGTFAAGVEYPTAKAADRIAIADMDRRNGPDLMVGLSDDAPRNAKAELLELRNRGDGTFEEGFSHRFPSQQEVVRALALGDLDDDGDIDVASSAAALLNGESYLYYGADQNRLSTLINPSGPIAGFTLPNHPSYYMDIRTTKQVLLNDLTGDGDLEVVALHGETSAWGSNPAEGFSPEVFVFSYDGVTHELSVLSRRRSSHIGFGGRMVIGDPDRDGDLDVLVTSGRMASWQNRPDGVFRVTFLENRGDRFTIEPLLENNAFFFPEGSALVDLDGDGRLDLVSSIMKPQMGLLVMRNLTEIAGPQLTIGELSRGQPVSIRVTDARPEETVRIVYSVADPGNSRGIAALGGLTLDLVEPIVLATSLRTDANGMGEVTAVVPPNAPLANVTFQAVARRGPGGSDSVKTNFVLRRIGD